MQTMAWGWSQRVLRITGSSPHSKAMAAASERSAPCVTLHRKRAFKTAKEQYHAWVRKSTVDG